MTRTLLCKASLIDGTGSPARADQDVMIADGRIEWVRPCAEAVRDGADVIELKGATLIPGLVNMHVHLRGRGAWGAEEPDDVALLRAAENARLSLSWGVTTLREAGSTERLSQTVRDAILSGVMKGPRVISAGRIITTSAGHGWRRGRVADSADEMRKAVRANVQDGVDTIKIAATGGGGTPGSNVGAPQYSAEELSVAAYEAHRLGKRVMVHCNGSAGTRNAVAAGVDTIEHIGWMGADGKLDVDDATIEGMIAKGITVVPTMAVWYRPGYDEIEKLSSDQKKMRAVRPERTEVWSRMYAMGARFATGTDTWDPIGRELELMVSEMGVTPMQALLAATRDAAIGLGMGDEVGTVAPGKVADLVQLDADPLADIANVRRVARVWRAGELVVEGGRVAV